MYRGLQSYGTTALYKCIIIIIIIRPMYHFFVSRTPVYMLLTPFDQCSMYRLTVT